MFSITSKAHYGIAAIMELAQQYGNGVTQIKDIAERRKIPKNYLEQIFNRLTRHGIIKSVRGKNGGYLLADDPAKISLLKILEALEGEFELEKQCKISAVQEIFREIEENTRKILDVTLADIILMQQKYDNQIHFYI